MNKQQIWEHVNKKYKNGEEKATFLMDVYNRGSKLLTLETRDAIRDILRTPICTGVVFGQLSRDYRERNGRSKEKKDSRITPGEYLQSDVENARNVLRNIRDHFGDGYVEGERFCVTYAENAFLLVSMKKEGALLDRLVAACSRVVEYGPFCRYTDLGGMQTYEWDKNNPDERYQVLCAQRRRDLVRLAEKGKKHDAMKQPERDTKGGER